jgi:phosphatidylinositol alpha-1,6-mannosyltransferase
LQYVVVGEGELCLELEKLAAETGVAGHVTFVGGVTDAQLAALYRACDVFVLPSRPQHPGANGGGEGFGRVYIEAALARKPVVGSRAGGAAEAVLDSRTGVLVNPLSVDEIAEAVLTLLQRPGVAACMGAEGRKWALEKFSLEAMRGQLVEMLRAYGAAGQC